MVRPTRLLGLAVAATLFVLAPAASAPAADPERYQAYYDVFDRGNSLLPGHDTRWTPQGLASWPEQDALVVSYYDGKGTLPSRLAVIDRASGRRKKVVKLPDSGHVGGLAMSADHLWVATDGNRVIRFRKATLRRTASNRTLRAAGAYRLGASSYATFAAGRLWVGRFDEDDDAVAFAYDLDARARPVYAGISVSTPSKVQGMAIVGGQVIWSRSYGRDNDSLLETHPLDDANGSPTRAWTAPNMSEGIATARGELHVLYESGSATYSDADYRVRTVHHGPLAQITG